MPRLQSRRLNRRALRRRRTQRGGAGKPSTHGGRHWCKTYATAADAAQNAAIKTYSGYDFFSGTVKFNQRDGGREITARIAYQPHMSSNLGVTHFIESDKLGEVATLLSNYGGYLRAGKPVWTFEDRESCTMPY